MVGALLINLGRCKVADVADHVGKEGTIRIIAFEARLQLNARELVAMHGKGGKFGGTEVTADDHRLIGVSAPEVALKGIQVDLAHRENGAQVRNGAAEIAGGIGSNGQGEGDPVIGQDLPMAIQNETAGRRNGQQGNGIAGRLGGIVGMLQ